MKAFHLLFSYKINEIIKLRFRNAKSFFSEIVDTFNFETENVKAELVGEVVYSMAEGWKYQFNCLQRKAGPRTGTN